jgi:hypothetical protein
MSESRPARPVLATILGIWLIVVFCFSAFSLASAALLVSMHAGIPHMPGAQLALAALSAVLALAGGITLLQMKPVSWQILIGRVAVELIALVLVLLHPVVVPASVAGSPNAAAITSMAKTGGAVFGVFMLLVNIGIALYARTATTSTAPAAESTPTAA